MSRSLDQSAVDDLHVDGQSAVERLDTRLTHRCRGVAVPGARPVDIDPGANGVDPALELGVVGLAEAFAEAGGDLAAPMSRRALAYQPDVESYHGAAFLGDHLGAHLVGHTGGHEQLDVDVLAGNGSHDCDLGVGKTFGR